MSDAKMLTAQHSTARITDSGSCVKRNAVALC